MSDRDTSSGNGGLTVSFDEFIRESREDEQLAGQGHTLATDVYAAFIKHQAGPLFRQYGFRGSVGKFELPSSERWLQIGLSKSRWGSRYRVSIDVTIRAISKVLWASTHPDTARPSPASTYWTRGLDRHEEAELGLEDLVPDGRYERWEIRIGQPAQLVFDRLMGQLTEHAIPWVLAVGNNSIDQWDPRAPQNADRVRESERQLERVLVAYEPGPRVRRSFVPTPVLPGRPDVFRLYPREVLQCVYHQPDIDSLMRHIAHRRDRDGLGPNRASDQKLAISILTWWQTRRQAP